ncbi:MAG: type II toxin-antitoxin system VapC family toxin [Planctomycetaceae bacterium]
MLIDTSGLLCCFDRGDERHNEAAKFFDRGTQRITHNYILLEFVALAQARRLPREPALRFIADATVAADLDVIWVDNGLHERGMSLLATQLDKTYSLCDAVSFLLMQEQGISEALTTDRHFDQAGFRRLLSS